MTLSERRRLIQNFLFRAMAVGDTRSIHYYRQQLQDLTTAVLRQEVRPTITQRIISFLGGKHGT